MYVCSEERWGADVAGNFCDPTFQGNVPGNFCAPNLYSVCRGNVAGDFCAQSFLGRSDIMSVGVAQEPRATVTPNQFQLVCSGIPVSEFARNFL